MTAERLTAVYVGRHHGAWLVEATGGDAHDAPTSETITCAASLNTAKRLARDLADACGFTGPYRWTKMEDDYLWTLTGMYEEVTAADDD